MIRNCLDNSGLGDFFGQQISADEVRVFKPSPVVYRHAAGRLSAPVGQIRLVTSNAFDCVGASAAGMRTAWVNRSAAPFDTISTPPDLTVPGLGLLPAALAGWTRRRQVAPLQPPMPSPSGHGGRIRTVAAGRQVPARGVVTSQMTPVSSPARWVSSAAAECPGVIREPSA